MAASRSRMPVAVVVVALLAGIGAVPVAKSASAQSEQTPKASKITNLLERMRDDTVAAKKNGKSPAGLSNRLSRVADDGGIDVTIWLKDRFIGR